MRPGQLKRSVGLRWLFNPVPNSSWDDLVHSCIAVWCGLCVFTRGQVGAENAKPLCQYALMPGIYLYHHVPRRYFQSGIVIFLLALKIKSSNYYPNIMPIYSHARHICLPQCRHVISSRKISFFLMPSYFQFFANSYLLSSVSLKQIWCDTKKSPQKPWCCLMM